MKFRDSVFLLSIVTIILLCFSRAVTGQQSVNLQKIAGSSGAIHALHHLENHLYVGAGAQIITLDVTDPSSPALDSTVSLVNQVRAIAVQEDIVYAAIGFSGLQIIDFTNHTSPILRGVIDTPDFAADLTVDSERIYVADRFGGLRIIYATDLDNPIEVASISLPNKVTSVELANQLLYVTTADGDLTIVDVRQPIRPQIITKFDGVNANSIHVVGNRLYAASGKEGLKVFDIKIPEVLTEIPHNLVTGEVADISIGRTLSHTFAYIMDLEFGVRAISIDEGINQFKEFGLYETSEQMHTISGVTNEIFVSNGKSTIDILKIDPDFKRIQKLAHWYTIGSAYDIEVLDNMLYVANAANGMAAIKIDNTNGDFRLIESQKRIETGQVWKHVKVFGNYIYATDGNFIIVAIARADSPYLVNQYRTSYAQSVTGHGSLAYIARSSMGVEIVDVSDLGNPQRIAILDTPGSTQDILVSNDFAYLADGESGFQVLGIDPPRLPQIIASLPDSGDGFSKRMVMSGDLLITADGFGGVRIIDVFNPVVPREISRLHTSSFVQDLYIEDNLVFLVDSGQGVKVIDISDLTDLTEIASYETAGTAFGLTKSGTHIFVADDTNGIVVLALEKTSDSPPFINRLSARTGLKTGNSEIRIYGENFLSGLGVFFGESAAKSVNVVSKQEIRVKTPVGELGTVDVTVQNPDGQIARFPSVFSYIPTEPKLELSVDQIDFGEVLLGAETPTSKSFVILNQGSGNLDISGILPPSLAFKIEPIPPFQIQPEKSQEVKITFLPKVIFGLNDVLNIFSNDPNSPSAIPLKGNVRGAANTFTVSGFGRHQTKLLTGEILEDAEILVGHEVRVTNLKNNLSLMAITQQVQDQPNYSVTFHKIGLKESINTEFIVQANNDIQVEVFLNGESRGTSIQSVTEEHLSARMMRLDLVIPFSPPTITAVSNLTTGKSNGGGNTQVQIHGTSFRQGLSVQIGKQIVEKISTISSELIEIAAPMDAPGERDIIITNVDGQLTTLTNGYTYNGISSVSVEGAPVFVQIGESVDLNAVGYEKNSQEVQLSEAPLWNIQSGADIGILTQFGKFTARERGTVKAEVVYKDILKPFEIIVVSGDTAQITLDAEPEIVTRDERASTKITALVIDSIGNPVLNETVVFQADSGSFSTVINRGDGGYVTIFTPVSSTKLGEMTIYANAPNGRNGAVVINLRARVERLVVEAEDDQVVADGFSSTKLTIRAIDIYEKPASDKVIEATTNLGHISLIQDNGDGTYTSTYTANTTTAGKAKIVVKTEFDIQALTEIRLIGGSTTNIELGISKSQLPADGKSTAQLRVKALDIYGNPVVNENLVFELKPELNSGKVGDLINHQDGNYVAEYITGTAVGEVEIRAKSSYGVFDQKSIRLTLGDTANFQLSMDPLDAVADGATPVDLILNVTDPHGNTIPNLSVAMDVSSGKIIRTIDAIGNDNYRGTYIPSTSTSLLKVTATLSNAGNTVVSEPMALKLLPGPPSPIQTEIVIEVDENGQSMEPPADGKEQVMATAIIRDKYRNSIPNVEIKIESQTINVSEQVQLVDEEGRASFKMSSSKTGDQLIHIKIPQIPNFDYVEFVRFSSPKITDINFTDLPDEISGDGITETKLMFTAKNNEGYPISRATIEVTSTAGSVTSPAEEVSSGLYQTTLTAPNRAGLLTIGVSPSSPIHTLILNAQKLVNIKVLPGDVSPVQSSVEVFPSKILANGVTAARVLITLVDKLGSPVPNRKVTITAKSRNVDIEQVEIVQSKTLTDMNGTAMGEIRSSDVGQITISVEDSTVADYPRQLIANPMITTVKPVAYSLTVVATPSSLPADGLSEAEIAIQILDASDNPLEAGEVSLTADGGTITKTAKNLGYGNYSAVFLAPSLPQVITISAETESSLTGRGEITIEKTDFTDPSFTAKTVNTTTIVLKFNETVKGGEGDIDNWTVNDKPISFFSGKGNEFTITLAAPIQTGDQPFIQYIGVADNPIVDLSGNEVDPSQRIIQAQDGISPSYTARVVGDNSIEIAFSEPIMNPSKDGWKIRLEGYGDLVATNFNRTDNFGLIWNLEINVEDGVSEILRRGESPVVMFSTEKGKLTDRNGNSPILDPIRAQSNDAPVLKLKNTRNAILRENPVNFSMSEGKQLVIFVEGEDKNNDELTFAVSELEDSKFEQVDKNRYKFIYEPSFQTVTAYEQGGVVKTATFSLTDSVFKQIQSAKFTVNHLSQAAQITLNASKSQLLAEETSETEVVATVKDALGKPVIDEQVMLTSDDFEVEMEHQVRGKYAATYRASNIVGIVVLSATTSNKVSAKTEIKQLNSQPDNIKLVAETTELPADGIVGTTLVVSVRDTKNRPISDAEVEFDTPQIGSISEVEAQGSGRYIAKYTTGEIDSPAVSFPVTASVSLNKMVLSASVDLSLKRPNRPPTLVVLNTDSKEIKGVTAPIIEGDSITLNLSGVDPDGDQVRFSVEALPTGAQLDQDGGFFWQTNSDTVQGKEGSKTFSILFLATDSLGGSTSQEVLIEVKHKSSAERLLIFASPDSLVSGENISSTITMILTGENSVRLENEAVKIETHLEQELKNTDKGVETEVESDTNAEIAEPPTSKGQELLRVKEVGNGVYTITIAPSTSTGLLQIRATVSNTLVSATANLRILPGVVTKLAIDNPVQPKQLGAGQLLPFSASGRDQFDNKVDLSTALKWEVTNGIGKISADGIFIAIKAGEGRILVSYNELKQESPEITVTTGNLSNIMISPTVLDIQIGQITSFQVVGTDLYDNPVKVDQAAVKWTISAYEKSVELGLFEGGILTPKNLGLGNITATFDSLIATLPKIQIVKGQIKSIEILPKEAVSLVAGEKRIFQVIGRDSAGNKVNIPREKALWKIVGNSITDSEGIDPGPKASVISFQMTAKHVGVGQVQLSVGETKGNSTKITVTSAKLAMLKIIPMNANLLAGSKKKFKVEGLDLYGNITKTPVEKKWSVIGSVGQIENDGTFTARKQGVGQVQIETAGFVQLSGQVTVRPGEIQDIKISAEKKVIDESVSLSVGESIQFVGIGHDKDNNEIDLDKPAWQLEGKIGEIANNGKFTALNAGTATLRLSYNKFEQAVIKIFVDSPLYLEMTDVGGGRSQEIAFPIFIRPLGPEIGEITVETSLDFPSNLLKFITLSGKGVKQISATSVGNRLDLKFTITPSFGTKSGIFRIDLSFFVLPTATDLATGEITIKDISLMLSKTKRQLDKIKILSSGSFTVLADIKLELDGLSLAPSQSGVIGLKLRKPDFQISKGQILIQTVPNIKILAFNLNKVFAKTMAVAKIDNGILLKVNQNPPNAEQVGTIEIEIPKTLDPKIKNEIKIEAEMYANEESKYGIVLQLGKIQIMDKIAPIGSFVINKTDIYTTDQMVILNTVATDVGFGVESMRFKNDEDFSQSDQKIKWIKFSPTVTNSASSKWNLSDEEGIKTVFCQFQDFSGNIITSSLSDQIIFDQTAPIGSISIVGDRTRQAGITIKLVASDELSNMKEVGEVRLRNEEEDFSDTDWKPFSDQIEWKVPSGEGIRTVFSEFRDGAGNVSEVASDSVEFDDLAPEVVSFNPDGTEDFVQVDTIISVEFSEEVKIDEQYLIVSSDKVDRIWGEIRTNTNRVTFVADEIFRDVEKISVIIKSGIPDLIGNPVAEEVSWSFTTGVGVFPGDTNKDGEVNAADIIPIGRFWREKGEPRQESTTNWVLQTAKPFKMQPATVADADGNGIVNADDIVPVALNWMKKTSEPRTVAEGSEKETETVGGEMNVAPGNFLDSDPNILDIYKQMHQKLLDLPGNIEGVIMLRNFMEDRILSLEALTVPAKNKLLVNYPNPFNPDTWIPFQISTGSKVILTIYNLEGTLIRQINLGFKPAGFYVQKDRAIYWDGRSQNGERVASGVYVYQLQAGVFSESRKLALIK